MDVIAEHYYVVSSNARRIRSIDTGLGFYRVLFTDTELDLLANSSIYDNPTLESVYQSIPEYTKIF